MAFKTSQVRKIYLLLALILGFSLASVSAQQETDDSVLALVLEARGKVEVRVGARVLPARESQMLQAGDRLELDGDASVLLLCSNGRVCEVRETQELDQDTCQCADPDRGRKVEEDGELRISDLPPWIPPTIDLNLEFGMLTVTGEARLEDPDWSRIPMLLAPRCPSYRNERLGCARYLETPRYIRWLAVDGVDDYRFALTGFPFMAFNVNDPATVRCSPLSAFDGRLACEVAWPEAWSLAAGHSYDLKVSIEHRDQRFSSEETSLSMLSTADRYQVRIALKRLSRMDLFNLPWARSLIYSGAGLANEAVSLLQSTVEETPSAATQLALGMAYRRIDALELAAEALQSTNRDQDATQALIDFHLGQTLSDLGRDTAAIEHLKAARAWFHELGSVREEVEAIQALSRAHRRNGRKVLADKLFGEAQELSEPNER